VTAPRILVIGSDESTGAAVGDVLQRDYFDVRRMPGFFSEHELSSQLQGSDRPALVVEGSGQWTRVFPALDCEETDRELVDRGARVPLLVVSAAITSREKARALDAGVEDVLSRPYGEEELVSRVKAILRRVRPHRGMEVITYKNISLDPRRHLAFVNKRPLRLVLTEFRLLQFFMTHPDFVYGRQHILDMVWGRDRYLDERTVNTYVRRLRNKLEAMSADVEFVSVRGVGYMFL
jgi:DNA-binding response OmpR family regulator|tara:strand:+ start:1384 stop:2088 length:705 start_codon:yes stop_codon:yes gene_type:complete